MSTSFERLHPAVQHHVVNSLGWRTLRPLQEASIEPVLAGEHALLGAPTAAGKTEAALLPLLSRMVDEQWSGLSVLYVCPLRALLNNLHPRAQQYAELLGRRAGLWHGDVSASERKAIVRDAPDLLLTTPESLEAMLMSRTVDARRLLGGVQAVVVDEIHAFAGDDRGWHLLAVLARIDALAGRELQRIGLTATVGNPAWLVDWLACGGARRRQVVMPTADGPGELDLTIDWVATTANAAKVISALHRGEKRLVFADSRSRVEELATALRAEGTTVFVSHSSLSRDDRRLAERAFAETRDCVIVATSTLELGIDVGDLDRVIQLGAPATVASLLQRIGRTGRRSGTVRNCLFLATTEIELLQAAALVRLVRAGWVEPLAAPPQPVNLLAQQLLARVLAEGRVGRSAWPGTLAGVQAAAGIDAALPGAVLDHMVARELLVEDGGLVAIGPEGEREYGRRHFMDVTSLFLTAPLLSVRWGQRELGTVDPSALATREHARPTILLGGRAWGVGAIDWNRRVVWVEPTDEPGASRWSGAGTALSSDVCHAIRATLADAALVVPACTRRAAAKLDEIRGEHWWAREGETALVADADGRRARWWTFAGARANRSLALLLDAAGIATASHDDLAIGLRGIVASSVMRETLRAAEPATLDAPVDVRRIEEVKFASCLPASAVELMLRARDDDPAAVVVALGEPLAAVDAG